MIDSILAALGVALLAGGEVFAFLAGLDTLLFQNTPSLLAAVLWGTLALSLLAAALAFRHVLTCERAGVARRAA